LAADLPDRLRQFRSRGDLRGAFRAAGATGQDQRSDDGVLNDYVTWIVLGLACLGGVLVLIVR